MNDLSILLLLPTSNEVEAIEPVMNEVPDWINEVMVVDGGSTDGTREKAEELGAKVVLQRYGKGKGCGVRTAMEEFLQTTHDVLLMIDTDGTCVIEDTKVMIRKIADGTADIVIGTRIRSKKRDKGSMPFIVWFGNYLTSIILSIPHLRLYSDVQSPYWAFSRNAVEQLLPKLKASKFEIELEMFTKAMKSGIRVSEVPVGYRSRIGHTKFSIMLRLRSVGFILYYFLYGFRWWFWILLIAFIGAYHYF